MPLAEDRFPEVLDEIQRERGLNDTELAALLEVSTRQLRNYRSSAQRPRWGKAVRIARKLGMEPKHFMGLEVPAA